MEDLKDLGGEMEDLGSEKEEEERWRVSCIVISHMVFVVFGM